MQGYGIGLEKQYYILRIGDKAIMLILSDINSNVNHKNLLMNVFDTVLEPQVLLAIVTSF